MLCYNKGIGRTVTEFWPEHGYAFLWVRQWCDFMFASTCKHHISGVLKCGHVTSFKLITLWIDKTKINVAVASTCL